MLPIMTKPGHIATLSIPDHAQVARGTLRALIGRAGFDWRPHRVPDHRVGAFPSTPTGTPPKAIDTTYDPAGLNSDRSIDSPIAL
ncbi:MAG: hypothetical protein DMF87_15395 [Acidobacteria bacterium]|nr:MAG: hypothetical protein DMF87_15395 [Acidobacteriota bacterium]